MNTIIEIIKENKWKSIIITFLLIVLAFGISYAAFYKSSEGTVKTGSIGNLDVTYTEGETFYFINSMPLLEEEAYEFAPTFNFSIKNTGNALAYAEISLSEIVVDDVLKNDENFKWALYEGDTKLSEGNFQDATTKLSLKKNISIAKSATKSYALKVWINDNGGNQNYLLNKNMNCKISVTVTETVVATRFDCTETIETYTIPESGNYVIEATGASGTIGNTYSFTGTPLRGGEGAMLSSTFFLNSGDELTIVVGCKGSVTDATANDGTGGAGGGGSFVFKKIDTITDSTYQFQKGSNYYETLLVAAGGGGTNDYSKSNSVGGGASGVGATWISPGGVEYSKTITAGTTNNTSFASITVLGISQFISYDLAGGYFKKNNGECRGGFGGGNCTDDGYAPGGGWSTTKASAGNTATSFSSGTNTTGKSGMRKGNGYINIYKD